ncbi:MAG TPA: T9SS type A sorting domain-containing protein, partial [Saprospiraceae bacterium]|nr:T9SS type A sorting domain-containing protein [Saprospiraceae bacterium]
DAAGRVYTAGFFQGTADFDPGVDLDELTSFGAEDIFISVLDADGTFIMARQMGGPGLEKPHAIDTDTAGNIYTSGYFTEAADFDPGSSGFILTSAGELDAYVSKLNADGEFLWAAQFGGPDEDRSLDMVVGDSAFVYTSGYFAGTIDLDPGLGTSTLTSFGATDAFLVVLKPCYPVSSEISPTACDSYTSPDGLEVWTVSGTYVDTLVLFGGCDSIITVHLTIVNSSTSEIEETACDTYTSPDGLEIWTVSGTYLDTLINSAGCDSIITIQLTILNSSTSFFSVTSCDSYISPDGLDKWDESGIYLDTLTNAIGCDSIITVELTIINSSESEINVESCNSYVSPDGLETWTESGTYMDTILNQAGCDSIITIQLTIHDDSAAEINVEACDSFTSPSGIYIWTESGIYQDTIPNAGGCDSIITIDLTINFSTSSTLDVTACDSLVSPSGQVWNTSGVYQDIIPNEAGCDSNMTINLTILHSSSSEITVTACDTYSLPGGTQTWTESGVYQDTLPNAVGCDSIVTVNLTINISPSSEIIAEACDSYISPTGAQVWTESGIYQEIVPLPGECDSIITVNLTINHSDTVEIEVTACESYVSPDGTEVWTVSGIYLDTIPTAAGCDSFMTIILNILSPSTSEITVEACDSFSLSGGTQTWTESGIYVDTIPNTVGCDSVVTVNLTISISPQSEITAEACDSYTSPSGASTWTESGIYYEYIPVGGACDSIVTYNLTIYHSTASTLDTTVCDSYLSPDGEETWTESGVYQDTIPNAIGCDSVVTVNLTINITPSSELTIEACDRYTLPGGTQTWTESGVYQEIFDTAGECDSVVTVNLTIHFNTTADLALTACDSYVSPSTNYVWTESGIYLDTITNQAGCDSFMTIDLSIITIDAGVTQDETLLTADMAGATYQWIDCDNADQPIDGATEQQFAPVTTGNYAVIVTSGDCVDTSACFNVIIVGTKDVRLLTDLKLYPNPASDHFVIEPGLQIGSGVITVSDLQGREVYTTLYRGEEKVVVPFEGPSGMYVVTLTGAGYRILGKVMVE